MEPVVIEPVLSRVNLSNFNLALRSATSFTSSLPSVIFETYVIPSEVPLSVGHKVCSRNTIHKLQAFSSFIKKYFRNHTPSLALESQSLTVSHSHHTLTLNLST
jgi:hypothetical protein